MEKQEKLEEEKKQYKSPILYLRKSKAGEHLYAFNVLKRDSQGNGGEGMVLGGDVESLILNVSDVSAVLAGRMKWAKVSVVLKEGGEGF